MGRLKKIIFLNESSYQNGGGKISQNFLLFNPLDCLFGIGGGGYVKISAAGGCYFSLYLF